MRSINHDSPQPPLDTCQRCRQAVRVTWGTCFRCQRWLGCSKCAAKAVNEVFCSACLAWGSLAAFVQHGPLLDRPFPKTGKSPLGLRQYPPSWQAAYFESEALYADDLLVRSPRTDAAHGIALAALDAFKRGETLPYEDLFVIALQQEAA